MGTRKTILLSVVLIIFSSALFVYLQSGRLTPEKSDSDLSALLCTNGMPADTSLATSSNLILRKLAEYEEVCGGKVVDELMIFASMPQTPSEATSLAEDMAVSLKEFSFHNISPLVLFEPSLTNRVDLSIFSSETYAGVLHAYYATLKSLDISNEEMGTWVLFPEANTPVWGTTEPATFIANVTKVGSLQKATFPYSKISILLNGRSYPSHDRSWSHGELKSLAPYVTGLPTGLIDRFGYQGFPSAAEADAVHQYQQFDAHDFMPAHLALEATKLLKVKEIWLNTGTFGRMYADQPTGEVHVDSAERRKTLETILHQAEELAARKLTVSINIFAQDKSLLGEHADWSYWKPAQAKHSPNTETFRWFVHEVRSRDMEFSLYDHT